MLDNPSFNNNKIQKNIFNDIFFLFGQRMNFKKIVKKWPFRKKIMKCE